MNAKEFFDKVAEMREYQKRFFKNRVTGDLLMSKKLEREIDEEIARVRHIMDAHSTKG